MTIDIHSLLEKNPITKKMLQPKFGYLGPSTWVPIMDL